MGGVPDPGLVLPVSKELESFSLSHGYGASYPLFPILQLFAIETNLC